MIQDGLCALPIYHFITSVPIVLQMGQLVWYNKGWE